MMEERYCATIQNRFYPDVSNVNKNITVEAKLISPPMYMHFINGANDRNLFIAMSSMPNVIFDISQFCFKMLNKKAKG